MASFLRVRERRVEGVAEAGDVDVGVREGEVQLRGHGVQEDPPFEEPEEDLALAGLVGELELRERTVAGDGPVDASRREDVSEAGSACPSEAVMGELL